MDQDDRGKPRSGLKMKGWAVGTQEKNEEGETDGRSGR